jgi:outer membrane protein assembly factor BamB
LGNDSLCWFKGLVYARNWSPSVWKDTIFVWLEGGLQALDFQTGEQFWYVLPYLGITGPNKSLQQSGTNLTYKFINPPAVIDTALRLAYLCSFGELYGVDLVSRAVLWEYNDKQDNYDDSIPALSPATRNGVVYTFFHNQLVALDGLSGEVLWRFAMDTTSTYHPVVANNTVFVSSRRSIYAIDLSSHELVWDYPVSGNLSISDGCLYVSSDAGYVYAFESVVTAVEENHLQSFDAQLVLQPNYPNPFNPSTTISYDLPTNSHVEVTIINVLGQEICTLADEAQRAGSHEMVWDGKDNQGRAVSSGVYFYRVQSDAFTQTRKMTLVR